MRPQVVVNEYAGKVISHTEIILGIQVPEYASKRYRVTCHRRCGRARVLLTHETLEKAFLEAIGERRADAAL